MLDESEAFKALDALSKKKFGVNKLLQHHCTLFVIHQAAQFCKLVDFLNQLSLTIKFDFDYQFQYYHLMLGPLNNKLIEIRKKISKS
jgi:hypothetical protein